jgi:hypothetical protein
VIKAAKKLLALGLLFVCVSGASYGDAWKLMASYPTPGPNPRGYSSTTPAAGFIVMDGLNPYVLRYSWEQGTIRSSFPAPGGPGAWGITRESGGGIFVTNNRTSWIYETTTQGSLVNSFRCPFDGPADCEFAWPGFIVAIPNRNIIALLNRKTGSLVGTYAGPGRRPTGCGGYAHFYVSDSGTHTVYEDGVPIITGIQSPVGFGYTAYTAPPYDKELYVIDDATDYYYWYTRTSEDIGPASLGRVKALFK